MLNFGCFNPIINPPYTPNYTLGEKCLLWLENAGISQDISVFCLVLMTMTAIKSYILQKADWGSSLHCFTRMATTTMLSLATGMLLLDNASMTDPWYLGVLWAGATALDCLVIRGQRGHLSVRQAWLAGLTSSTVAVGWLAYLNVPSLYVWVDSHVWRSMGY